MPVVIASHCYHLTSYHCLSMLGRSNAVEAYLLDGECVMKWTQAALEREENHILQGLSRGLSSLATLGELHKHVGRLSCLVSILEALLQPATGEASAKQDLQPLQRAQQLHQCAKVSMPSSLL
jgi:hypothetical protein